MQYDFGQNSRWKPAVFFAIPQKQSETIQANLARS